jgi:hypothetical protein
MNYTKEHREWRKKHQHVLKWGPSKTRSEFADDVNINKIVQRARLGQFVAGSVRNTFYDDVSEIGDYQSTMERLQELKKEFDKIPSDIRKKFGNNPEDLATWVKDPKNEKQAVEWGLLEKRSNTTNNPKESVKTDSDGSKKDNTEPKGE